MDLWNVGFAFLAAGVAVPIVYALYKFVLTSIPWYWRLSVILVLSGVVILAASAAKDRTEDSSTEEKY